MEHGPAETAEVTLLMGTMGVPMDTNHYWNSNNSRSSNGWDRPITGLHPEPAIPRRCNRIQLDRSQCNATLGGREVRLATGTTDRLLAILL